MASGEGRQRNRDCARPESESPATVPRVPEAEQRSDEQAVPALENERAGGGRDRGQRVLAKSGARPGGSRRADLAALPRGSPS